MFENLWSKTGHVWSYFDNGKESKNVTELGLGEIEDCVCVGMTERCNVPALPAYLIHFPVLHPIILYLINYSEEIMNQ